MIMMGKSIRHKWVQGTFLHVIHSMHILFENVNLSLFIVLSMICYMVLDITGISAGPHITKTSPCNEHPLTPHFYIVKLGFTGVCFFSYFCSKT